MKSLEEGTRHPLEVIVREDCQAALDRYYKAFPRARDVVEGLLWRLSRDPECGARVSLRDPRSNGDGQMRMVKSELNTHVPTVTLMYNHEPERLHLVYAHVAKPGYDAML